ncbi:hypothetical protein WHR41_04953 [Cladosporium halotolerans]|uniref:Uncharacterized protein n=1 Tax=Cladosporium halotolerans TaxID=1052096 RepID=A0AB34KQ66_9PEZI
MQFTVLAIAAFTAFTSAAAIDKRAPSDVCPSIDTPQCCQLDVDGVVDATCASPGDVSTLDEFNAACAETGTTAMCCTIPLAGLGLLCAAP